MITAINSCEMIMVIIEKKSRLLAANRSFPFKSKSNVILTYPSTHDILPARTFSLCDVLLSLLMTWSGDFFFPWRSWVLPFVTSAPLW